MARLNFIFRLHQRSQKHYVSLSPWLKIVFRSAERVLIVRQTTKPFIRVDQRVGEYNIPKAVFSGNNQCGRENPELRRTGKCIENKFVPNFSAHAQRKTHLEILRGKIHVNMGNCECRACAARRDRLFP
jgi:hypothetical protein